MNKTAKRIISIIVIAAVLCGALWGGLILIRNTRKKPVNVYSVSDFSTNDFYGSSSQTSGMVTMDNMQKVMLTETQTVKEILVKEGQTVKKGDPILSYDTTLTDIDLEKAKIELSRLQLQKTTAENELAKLKKMKPHSSVLITPPSSNITYEPQETPLLLGGSGTESDPFYYLWDENDSFETKLLNQMFPGNQTVDPPSQAPDETSAPNQTEAPDESTSAKEPETEEPDTKAPETEEPGTKAPETKEPGTKTPETKEPGTKAPETEEPGTKAPETEEPGSKEPETKEPGSRAETGDSDVETPGTDHSDKETPANTQAKKTGSKTSATPKTGAAPTVSSNSNESYVVLIVRENNALNGQVVNTWGLHLDKSSGEIKIRLFQADLPEDMMSYDTEPEPYYQESGSDYTASELAQMKVEKEQEIKDLEVSIKIAELELKEKEHEATDGTVLSTIDGTIKALRDPNEAFQNSEPVVEVSAGGGYYIDGALSELELGTVQTGQTVQVNSWVTGTSCEGKIVEISTYPTTNANSWSDSGNTNVSYYPFRIFVDESENLTENDYVDVTYQNQAESDGNSGIFLESSFIRTENGRSYVYIRNEKGLLEQRTVQTGRDLYGYYTEIRSGLTAEDYIAFPYGNDVADGAKTNESTPDALYGY